MSTIYDVIAGGRYRPGPDLGSGSLVDRLMKIQLTGAETGAHLIKQLVAPRHLARASIAPLIARVVENPDLAAEAARTADAIARN